VAYVLRTCVHDPRIATTHDYRRKGDGDILASGTVGWNDTAERLAQAMSAAERRGDACEGRSVIIAVPHELNIEQSADLVADWCRHLNKRHGVACVWIIHAPDSAGDERNIHAHVVVTARRSHGDTLREKARELDDRRTGPAAIEEWRTVWGNLAEGALRQVGKGQQVDMRSWKRRLNAEGLPPDLVQGEEHLGPARSSAERRGRKTAAGDRNRRKRRRRKLADVLIGERREVIGGNLDERPRTERAPKAAPHVKQAKDSSKSINSMKRKSSFETTLRTADRVGDHIFDEIAKTAKGRDDDQR